MDSFEPAASPQGPSEQRRSKRATVNASVALRRFGHAQYQVTVFDLSLHGCKVEFVERPTLAERVWIRFEGLASIQAQVRWLGECTIGAEFTNPIYPAVYDALLARLR